MSSFEALFNCASLATAVKTVNKAIPKKPLIPIYYCILLSVTDRVCTITGGDSDRQIRCTLPAVCDKNFRVCIPSDPMIDILSGFPEDDIRIVISKNAQGKVAAQIKTMNGKRSYKIPIYPASEYPEKKIDDMKYRAVVDSTSFIPSFLFAAAPVNDKNIVDTMKGVRLQLGINEMTISGVQGGAWFNKATLPCTTYNSEPSELVIPDDAISFITPSAESPITIEHNGKWCSINWNGVTGVFSSFPGVFPRIESIISKMGQEFAEVDKVEFTGASKRLGMIGDNVEFRINLDFKEDSMVINSHNELVGSEGTEEIQVMDQGMSGRNFYVNNKFIQLIVNSIPGDAVELHAGPGKTDPLFITSSVSGCLFIAVIGKLARKDDQG